MRKIRDVVRLTFAEQLSRRQVSASLGIPFTTICEYVERSRLAGLSWPLPENLAETAGGVAVYESGTGTPITTNRIKERAGLRLPAKLRLRYLTISTIWTYK